MPSPATFPDRRDSPPRPAVRVAAWALLAAALPLVLLLTLSPGTPLDLVEQTGPCLVCGDDGLSNLIRNIVLFLPLGLAAGLLTGSLWFPVIGAVVLSGGIELAQFTIPGRNPLLVDFAMNVLGAGIGAGLGLWALDRLAGVPPSGWLANPLTWAGGACTVLLATGWLYSLSPPDPPYYVNWRADHGHLERYQGEVVEVRLDDVLLTGGRVVDPDRISARLLAGGPLVIVVEAGPPPSSLAPLLSVHTGDEEEVFVLGASGPDLVLRLPYRATRLRMARPDLVAPDALAGVEEGETVEVGLVAGDRGSCILVNGAGTCEILPSLAEGWALLLFPSGIDSRPRGLLSLLWLVALGFPSGFLAATPRVAGGCAIGLALAALLIGASPVFLPGTEFLVPGALAGGVATGFGARRVVVPVPGTQPAPVDGSRPAGRRPGSEGRQGVR